MISPQHEAGTLASTKSNGARERPLRVLYVTSQWPNPDKPDLAPFVRREVEALRATGIDLDVFVYKGGWSLLSYIRAIREMRRRLRTRRYDIIHARFGQCGLVARAQWRVPVVITYAGSDVEGTPHFAGRYRYRNYLLRAISWLLSLLVDEVIVVSDHLGRKLPTRHYHVIPGGIDFSLFRPIDQPEARHRLDLPSSQRLILFAGNPANRTKRYDLALQACMLASNSIGLQLIVLTGKPAEQVLLYMSACDVLLLTSSNEGSPNVVKEALACNLPIVSVNVGDVCERIQQLDGCVVCKTDDPDVIASGLIKVLTTKKRLNSRELIRKLDINELAKDIVNVYLHRVCPG